ncbi:DUF6449 domain-containing protein [Ruminococcus sp. CLA-AA-H200]|uniref:DUF6449 domain-containing protein n=1 Tax=Ruminococcus turbiniformis TaxID=2881258 RepID=A0ABS8FY54_9FIRM|nr:DUF6449 domain-containing protein [Ruminococcus turbiniformis]MCC2254514.1 DUF6449 domain-containing protein [Ruminococcus turbiniformis]
MTSAKCFISWVRESGRGHLAACAGWGTAVLYGILSLTRLSFDTENTFFGIGSVELWRGCAALGIVMALLEFFYLLQPAKLDFYYSLPVSRKTIFWSRYVHGIIHGAVPAVLVMAACGIYQASIDTSFDPYTGSYTGKSIFVCAAVFFLFYHIGIASLTVCGNIVSAVLAGAVLTAGFPLLIQGACIPLSENYFDAYYRIPLTELLNSVLSPLDLASGLFGRELYLKPNILAFSPDISLILAVFVWILALFAVFAFAQKARQTERVGRAFVLLPAERVVETWVTFLCGILVFSFFTELLTGTAGAGNRPGTAAMSAAGAAAVCVGVHCLMEGILKKPGAKLMRRRWQLAGTGAAAVCAGAAFAVGAPAYDGWFPEDAQAVGISINGLDMNYDTYREAVYGDTYVIDGQLAQYELSGEGKAALLGWLEDVVRGSGDVQTAGMETTGMQPEEVQTSETQSEETSAEITRATVCYRMENGTCRYRSYPVTETQLAAFSAVYNTEEYKTAAYPAVKLSDVSEDRFTWRDGVKDRDLPLNADEKEALLEAWREDISSLEMEELSAVLPCGFVRIRSSTDGSASDLPVYPFFEKTCGLLERYGTDTGNALADYTIDSVEVLESTPVPANVSGGVHLSVYDKTDEIAELAQKLVPDELDIQPLLCPLEHTGDVEAVVTDEETNSLIRVDCVMKRE